MPKNVESAYLRKTFHENWKENDVLYAMGRKAFIEADNAYIVSSFNDFSTSIYGEGFAQTIVSMLKEIEDGKAARDSLISTLTMNRSMQLWSLCHLRLLLSMLMIRWLISTVSIRKKSLSGADQLSDEKPSNAIRKKALIRSNELLLDLRMGIWRKLNSGLILGVIRY